MANRNRASWSIPSRVRSAFFTTLILVAGFGTGGGGLVSCRLPGSANNAATTVTQADGPLIPRRVLFGNPEKTGPTLSDDGKQLAFRAAVNGVMNVWVGPANEPEAAKPVTKVARWPHTRQLPFAACVDGSRWRRTPGFAVADGASGARGPVGPGCVGL